MKRLLLAAGLALILHGLLFSVKADWLRDELVKVPEQQALSLTLNYRVPVKSPVESSPAPLLEIPGEPVKKKPPLPPKKKPARPKKPVPQTPSPLSAAPSPPPEDAPETKEVIEEETVQETSTNPPPFEVGDLDVSPGSEFLIWDKPPAGEDSGNYDMPENVKDTELHGEEGIVYPQPYKDNPRPEYPGLARRRRYEGVVVIEALVSRNGEVQQVRVLKSSGHSILDEEAMEAVRRYRFEPGREHGRNVNMWVNIPIRFQLK